MDLSTALILGFLFHLIGDYLFQNNWMAQNKTKHNLPAIIHAGTYSTLFLLLVGLSFWWVVIFATHFFIDRYRLAVYWIKLVNNSWEKENFGYGKDVPIWMSVWLMIIIDNTIHLTINSMCIIACFYFGE